MATSTDVDQRRDALVGRLFEATVGAMDVFAVYIGDRLGLYRPLAERGALTSGELAEATGTHERYAREWLEPGGERHPRGRGRRSRRAGAPIQPSSGTRRGARRRDEP
jgi:hypothetical protein